MGPRIELNPDGTRRQSKDLRTKGTTATNSYRGGLAGISAPPGATSEIGGKIVSVLTGFPGVINPQLAAVDNQQAQTEQATEAGVKLHETTDEANRKAFETDPTKAGSIESEARARAKELTGQDQFGQQALQIGTGILQAGTQGLQQVGQQFQQVGQQLSQSVGQVAQQGSQLMSKVAEQQQGETPSTDINPDGVGGGTDPGIDFGDAGLGGGGGGGLGGGGLGGGTDPAATTGEAVAPYTSTAYAGGRGAGAGAVVAPVATSPTSGTPMGGAPMIPPRGGIGGAAAANKKNEDTDIKPLLDTDALPYVDQQLGAMPTVDAYTEDEGPSFDTETFK